MSSKPSTIDDGAQDRTLELADADRDRLDPAAVDAQRDGEVDGLPERRRTSRPDLIGNFEIRPRRGRLATWPVKFSRRLAPGATMFAPWAK